MLDMREVVLACAIASVLICRACGLLTDHPMQYISICASVKDETMDLREWVDYHYVMGVSKIYIMDHGSKAPLINYLVRRV